MTGENGLSKNVRRGKNVKNGSCASKYDKWKMEFYRWTSGEDANEDRFLFIPLAKKSAKKNFEFIAFFCINEIKKFFLGKYEILIFIFIYV